MYTHQPKENLKNELLGWPWNAGVTCPELMFEVTEGSCCHVPHGASLVPRRDAMYVCPGKV